MLDDQEIRDFFNDTDLPLVDIVSKDRLPDKRYIGDYVINMQNDDDGNGTHWVFAKITDKGKGLYFDSFGVYPPEQVKKFIHPLKLIYNTRQIQDIKSEMCGYFCSALAYFLKYDSDPKKSLDQNFVDFIEMFCDNTKDNDKILKEYLKKNRVNNDFN
jgi:hypothetical protein